MVETYSNNPRTILNGAINSSVITITVSDASSFPSIPSFRILIENEILQVITVSGTMFGVMRGTEGTIAVSHVDQTPVIGIFPTKASLAAFRADNIIQDTVANRPSAGVTGRLYFPTNGNGSFARDNGSTWDPILGNICKLSTPISSNFTIPLNSNSETFSNNGDAAFYHSPSNNGSSAHVKSTPAEPWTVTAQFDVNFYPSQTGADSTSSGIIIRQSTDSTKNIVVFGFHIDGIIGAFIGAQRFNNNATFTWNNVNLFVMGSTIGMTNWIERPSWFRIFQPTSGNRTYSVSCDGQNFIQLFAQDRANVLTPDQIGFFQRSTSNNAHDVYMTVRSYLES